MCDRAGIQRVASDLGQCCIGALGRRHRIARGLGRLGGIRRRRYDIEWTLDAQAVAYDQKSDGMYPLLTNDRSLSPAQGPRC